MAKVSESDDVAIVSVSDGATSEGVTIVRESDGVAS